MRVAHFVVVTPGRCGLYETTREMVVGLRRAGVNSRIVDPTHSTNKLHPGGNEDRGAIFASLDWARSADVIVSHSGLGEYEKETEQPIILVAHGRPRSSFIGEVRGGTPVYSYHYNQNASDKLKAVVTLWPEHVPYHEVMFPDKPVHYVPAPVDLEAWNPRGPSGYGFHDQKGRINLVCTDAWRDDEDPFAAVNAYALWARKNPGTKLHIYAAHNKARGWGALFKRLRDDGTLGEVQPWVKGLDNVYRAADALITTHRIDVRSVREAMACGCPVVRVPGSYLNGYASDIALALEEPRNLVRQKAEKWFNPDTTAIEFKKVLES